MLNPLKLTLKALSYGLICFYKLSYHSFLTYGRTEVAKDRFYTNLPKVTNWVKRE